jgi:pyruvate formate lyase activating enzyme
MMLECLQPEVNGSVKGIIFDVKRFATSDGPGIRTLVFLKGCPLKCRWCANPESQSVAPELIYYSKNCMGCGRCVAACPQGAIQPNPNTGSLMVDRKKCTACGKCVDVCYYEARKLVGQETTVSELIKTIRKDKQFYDNSNGGVTLTGGEPLSQPDFSRELLKACKQAGISTAMETSGYAPWQQIEGILPYLDLLFLDIKQVDPELHREFTGVSNAQILGNLAQLNEKFGGDLIVRIPFIPNCNNSDEIISRMIEFVSHFKTVKRIEVLPYHRFGITKYAGLDRHYDLEGVDAVRKQDLEYLQKLGNRLSITVQVDAE